jgi:hypothetical protein
MQIAHQPVEHRILLGSIAEAMVRDLGALNKTQKRRICGKTGEVVEPRRIYRKAGMHGWGIHDDSSGVSAHGIFLSRWVTLGMLLLNLAVWLDAAARLAS